MYSVTFPHPNSCLSTGCSRLCLNRFRVLRLFGFQVNDFFLWDSGLIFYLLSHFINIYIYFFNLFITGLSDKRLIPINKKNNTHWILPTAVYQVNFIIITFKERIVSYFGTVLGELAFFFFSKLKIISYAIWRGWSITDKTCFSSFFFFAIALWYWPVLDLHSKIFLYFLPKQAFPTNLEI